MRTRPRIPRWPQILTGTLILVFYVAIASSAALIPDPGARGVLVDFDAFYIVGGLVAEGRAADAYDPAVMAGIQRALVGHEGFMPWTYPPPFDLVAALLALAPRGLSYGLFTGLSLAFYLWVLARLAGPGLGLVLLALTPPVYVAATIGQNAFLTAGLMGLYCLMALQGRSLAGLPLGLLVIKPHLGIGLGVQALAAGHWRVIGLAASVTLALSLVATLALGAGIWGAFRQGMDAAGHALAVGFYPLFRMTSAYALAHTLGLEPAVALALQIVVALGALALVALAVRRHLPAHHTLAAACFASTLVSPYLYDYDMTIAGIGLALVLADLRARASRFELALLLALAWLAGGWGMLHAIASAGLPWEERAANARATTAFGALAWLVLLAMIARLLRRRGTPA